jgi:hypothetical protein
MRDVGKSAVTMPADKKGRVRPGGLRQILDRHADLRIALDQQDVSGLEAGEQLIRRSGWTGPVDMPLPAQIAGKSLTDLFERDPQRSSPSVQLDEPDSPVT